MAAARRRAYWPRGNGAQVCRARYGGGRSSAGATAPLPSRQRNGTFVFEDAPAFRPNVAPWEVLRAGAFGGTYFRAIDSGVTGARYTGAHKEFPAAWFDGMDTARTVTSDTYDKTVNKYGVKCGSTLEQWEAKEWIHASAPFGWFQWYCRFFMGLRHTDDARQIKRWVALASPAKGRFARALATAVKAAGGKTALRDASVSPARRQTLLHWGMRLSAAAYTVAAAPRK